MKIAFLAILCGLLAISAGCVRTVAGGHKAAVPFGGKDKIEGRYERTVPKVFETAKVVLARLGTLNSEDTINRTLTAKVDTRSIWVRVSEVDKTVTSVTVQARTRGGTGDVTLAAQIEKEIALALATGK